MALSREDISEILEIIDAAGPGEVRIETEGFALHVAIGEHASLSGATATTARAIAGPPETAAAGIAAPAGGEPEAERAEGVEAIDSPMLGTFYRSESPGSPPFVEPGTTVEADTVVCIIEVMKMMNSVVAGVAGEVVEVCAQNGVLVEYGEPLFLVKPA